MRTRLFYKEKCKLNDLTAAIHLLSERLDDPRYEPFKQVLEKNLNYTIQEKDDLLCDMKKMGWDGL